MLSQIEFCFFCWNYKNSTLLYYFVSDYQKECKNVFQKLEYHEKNEFHIKGKHDALQILCKSSCLYRLCHSFVIFQSWWSQILILYSRTKYLVCTFINLKYLSLKNSNSFYNIYYYLLFFKVNLLSCKINLLTKCHRKENSTWPVSNI